MNARTKQFAIRIMNVQRLPAACTYHRDPLPPIPWMAPVCGGSVRIFDAALHIVMRKSGKIYTK